MIPGIARGVADVAVKIDKMSLSETGTEARIVLNLSLTSGLVFENRAIMEWLAPLNFFRAHDEILDRRTVGTGLWFLNSPNYRSWVDSLGGTMWCPGIRRSSTARSPYHDSDSCIRSRCW